MSFVGSPGLKLPILAACLSARVYVCVHNKSSLDILHLSPPSVAVPAPSPWPDVARIAWASLNTKQARQRQEFSFNWFNLSASI